jgi:outer membrane protein TolC
MKGYVSFVLAGCLATATTAAAEPLAVGADASAAAPGANAVESRATLLAMAVDAAWSRAVLAREAERTTAVARAETDVAGSWTAAAPAFEATNRTGDWGNASGLRETELAIALPIWIPGQRSASGAAARAGLEAAGNGERAARLKIAGEVREALWTLAARDAEARGKATVAEHLKAFAADAERRVGAGDAPRIDGLAARAEYLAAEGAAAEADVALDAAARRWTTLTGLPVPMGPSLDFEPAADGTDASIDQHPDARIAALQAERARAQLQAVRRAPAEPPEVKVIYREDVFGAGVPVERSVGIGLRVPFGGSARRALRNGQAAGDLQVAETAAERTREMLGATVEGARRSLAAAEHQFEAEQARHALLTERLGHVERSYRAGETSLAELIRDRIAAAQAQADRDRSRAALGLARARLHQSLGSLP